MTTLKTEHVLYMFHDIHEAYACVTMGPVEALTLLLYSYPLLEYVMECSIFMNKMRLVCGGLCRVLGFPGVSVIY